MPSPQSPLRPSRLLLPTALLVALAAGACAGDPEVDQWVVEPGETPAPSDLVHGGLSQVDREAGRGGGRRREEVTEGPTLRRPAEAAVGGDRDDLADPPMDEPAPRLPPPGTEPIPDEEPAVDAPTPGVTPLRVRASDVTSSTVTVAWDAATGATSYEVLLGAEPGETPEGPLPGATSLATLPATAGTYTITDLAAGTDAFVRVQSIGGTAPAGNVHARTVGGPRASLDDALRSVHAYGTHVLMLVVSDPGTRYDRSTESLVGDDGSAWAAGTWSVRRADGRAIAVRSVHRESRPVGQPSYPVGFEAWPDDTVVDVDHNIFLVLGEPLGARDLLSVSHTGRAGTELSVRVPYSDRYLETPLIQVNQVGYNPRASRRWAYVSGWMGNGGAASPSTLPATAEVLIEPVDGLRRRRVTVGDLPIRARAAADVEAAAPVHEIDLATVPAVEGRRYRVRVPGVGVSWPTAVSEEAALRSFYTVARGLFHNRWCGDLRPDLTEWSRPADHCAAFFVTGRSYRDTMFTPSTPLTGERPVRGGHHDAGDFDIRPYHVLAGQYLLRAFEMSPTRFRDGQLTIPESGNGVPDLLDEALWSVQAWLDLQNPDGSVRAGVESYRHPAGIHKAHADELPYWTFDPEPWHTAYVAALFAQAARLVRPYDATRSAQLGAAARSAYGSAVAQRAPAAYRLFAASELTALTGEARYVADFAARWAEMDRHGRGAFDSFQNMTMVYPGSFNYGPAMADFVMGYAQSPAADAGIVAIIRREIRRLADEAAARILESPHAHRNGRDPRDSPDWGHTNSTGRHADLIYQALELGGLPAATSQRYFDAMSVSADYALGCNPAGLSYLTGLGSRRPEEPLHLDSLAFVKDGMPPMPGIPIYGPIATMPGMPYYDPVEVAFYPAFSARPPGSRLVDSRTAVNSSEFTVWENQAPFTELFAALAPAGVRVPSTWLPRGAAHRDTLPEHYAE